MTLNCCFDTETYQKLLGIGIDFAERAQRLREHNGVKGFLLMVDYGGDIGILSDSFGTLAANIYGGVNK